MRKKDGVTLYNGGLIVIGVLILIGLIRAGVNNLPKRSAYYTPSYTQTEQTEQKEDAYKYKYKKWNEFEGIWEYASPTEILRYNLYKHHWEYAEPSEKFDSSDVYKYERLRYNSFENIWEYASPTEILKYNPYEHHWEYEEP